MAKQKQTRIKTADRIYRAADELFCELGYDGVSMRDIAQRAGVNKASVFYHFKSKSDLAHALIDRYARKDDELLKGFMARAEKLSRDPLQQVLIFLGLLYEVAHELVNPHPGCLFASYSYESRQFDDRTKATITKSMLDWRNTLGGKLREAMHTHPTRLKVDPESLADHFVVTAEGSYVMSKIFSDPKAVAEHLAHYKNYLELLFSKGR